MNQEKLFKERIDLKELNQSVELLKAEISKVIYGQDKLIELMITAILANGHVLIEGVPGTAKTLSAKLIAKAISANFSRIQFTPDLMPSDILGTSVFNMGDSKFEFNPGPIFSNIILVDEINRAPAKTQSALFEAMQEEQVTVDGKTYKMKLPFIVFSTQNPIEHEGTYRLPEAQLDRFLFKIVVGYPNQDAEEKILLSNHERESKNELDEISIVLSSKQVKEYQEKVKQVKVEQNLIKYIVEIVRKSREHSGVYLGASPRAAVHILTSSKAYAAINGRDFVTPEDIQFVLYPILIHRLHLMPEAELEGISNEKVIKDIIQGIEVPR